MQRQGSAGRKGLLARDLLDPAVRFPSDGLTEGYFPPYPVKLVFTCKQHKSCKRKPVQRATAHKARNREIGILCSRRFLIFLQSDLSFAYRQQRKVEAHSKTFKVDGTNLVSIAFNANNKSKKDLKAVEAVEASR